MKRVHSSFALFISSCATLVTIGSASAATGDISTVAGTTQGLSGDGGAATSAQLQYPSGVARDGAGNLYIADYGNHRIRKVNTNGVISTVAGSTQGFSGDGGAATSAQLNNPYGVACDSAGNLYIADKNNHRVRKVNTSGIISTVAGSTQGFSGDGGAATSAQLNTPTSVAVDSAGNLYIADQNNHRIRKVNTSGVISTVAGNGSASFSGDGGAATAAQLNSPTGVAADGPGNLYIADTNNNRIRKVNTSGVISTFAGNGTASFSGDGAAATSAQLNFPTGVAADSAANLFIADTNNNRVRKVSTSGIINTVAGNGTASLSGDGGPATSAQLNNPTGVAVESAGNLYLADYNNQRIRKVEGISAFPAYLSINSVSAYEGNSTSTMTFTVTRSGGTDGAVSVQYATSDGTATAGSDYVATSGTLNFAVNATTATFTVTIIGDTTVEPDETFTVTLSNAKGASITTGTGVGTIFDDDTKINTYAGNGTAGFSGDGGAATAAQLNKPFGVARDRVGNLFIADTYNNRIRKITTNGVISTAAGIGSAGFSGDGGAATAALLNSPFAVAVDSAGNLFIADVNNQRIRKVDVNGIITTVAGTTKGFSGDGGAATSAQFDDPVGVAVDSTGNLYIADYFNVRIRKVNTSGIISTYAGNGTAGFSGDGGAATAAELQYPNNVTTDSAGNLFIADTDNGRIRKVNTSGIISTAAAVRATGVAVDSAGNLFTADYDHNRINKVSTSGVVSTVAGTGVAGFSGDGGPAIAAKLNAPFDVTLDVAGNLYIADRDNNRIRKVGLVNNPPVIDAQALTVRKGTASTAQVFASDADNDPLTYSTTSTLPAGLTLASNGQITGTPTAVTTPAGVTISVTVSDGQGGTASANVTIIVKEAASLVVTSAGDTSNDYDEVTTLREAINAANASGGSSTIVFNLGTSPRTIDLGAIGDSTSGASAFLLNANVTIQGPGANLLTVRRVSGGDYRIFRVPPGVTATISGLTITNGYLSGDMGGGILNQGTLTLQGCAITNNYANSAGGIKTEGPLTLDRCTVSGNSSGSGGGIMSQTNLSGLTTVIRNSTISGNTSANYGGGLENVVGLTQILNSTITRNTAAEGDGSGVFSHASSNTRTEVYDSIIANNVSTDLDQISGASSYLSDGHNLVGYGTGSSAFTAAGDTRFVTNPKLGPLANNGGGTYTHALLLGSPAIDAGATASVSTDQRGLLRQSGGTVDIGAYELQPETYAFWSSYSFPLNTDPTSSAPSADYDGDGISNALEQALGSDPLVRDRPDLAVQYDLQGGYLVLQFERSITIDPAKLVAEASLDLQTWSSMGITYSNLGPASSNTELLQALIPIGGAPKKFGRLRYTP